MSSDSPGRQLKVLERRHDYLRDRLRSNDLPAGMRDYVLAEAKALRWAIDILRIAYPRSTTNSEDVCS